MSTTEKNSNRKQFAEDLRAIRKLFRKFCDPLPGSPYDEYDSVIPQVLSSLHKGPVRSDIEIIVAREFAEHFGLVLPERQVKELCEEIVTWWEHRRSSH